MTLTTKLPAICSLLQRVLEMEEKATPGPWEDTTHINSQGANPAVRERREFKNVCTCCKSDADAAFISFSRNITKPMATALLGDIEAWQKIAANEVSKPDHWTACHQCESNKELAEDRLQSIADAFPDALFQDSSRCA